jgi:hypothetical protein
LQVQKENAGQFPVESLKLLIFYEGFPHQGLSEERQGECGFIRHEQFFLLSSIRRGGHPAGLISDVNPIRKTGFLFILL